MPMPGVKGGGGRGFLASEQELEVMTFVNIPRYRDLCGLRCGSVEGDPAWLGQHGALHAQPAEAGDGQTFDQTGVVEAPLGCVRGYSMS